MTSRGLRTLCDGPETPIQWKSESISNGRTDQLTGIGARDAHAYKKKKFQQARYSPERGE